MVKSLNRKPSRSAATHARRYRHLPPAATPQLGVLAAQAAPAPTYTLAASPWYHHQAYQVTDSLAPRYSFEARGFATEPEQLINEFAEEFTLVETLLGLLTDLQKLKHPYTTPNILATATAQYLLSLNRWAAHQGVGTHLTGVNLQGNSLWGASPLTLQVGRIYGELLDPWLAFNQRLLSNIALYTLADYTNLNPQRLSHLLNQEMHLGHTRLIIGIDDAAFFNYNSESFRAGMHAHWTAYVQADGSYYRISDARYVCYFDPQTKILPQMPAFWDQFKSIAEQPLYSLRTQRQNLRDLQADNSAQSNIATVTASAAEDEFVLVNDAALGVSWDVPATIANRAYRTRGMGITAAEAPLAPQTLFYATSYHSLVHLMVRLASDSTLAPLVASLTPILSEIRKTTQGSIPAHLRERLIKSLFQRYLEMAIGVDSTKQQFAISHAEQSWGLLGLPLVMLMLLQPWTQEQRELPLHDLYKVFAVAPQAREAEYVTRVATLLSYVNYRAQAQQVHHQWLNWQRLGEQGHATVGELTTLVSLTSKFYDYAQQYLGEVETELATLDNAANEAPASTSATKQLLELSYREFLSLERLRLYRLLSQAWTPAQLWEAQGVATIRGRGATTVGLGNYAGNARKSVRGHHALGGVHPHLLQPRVVVRPPLLAATMAVGTKPAYHAISWDLIAHAPSVLPSYNSWATWNVPSANSVYPLIPPSGGLSVRELCYTGIMRALQHLAPAHHHNGRTSPPTQRLGMVEVPAWSDHQLSPFAATEAFAPASFAFDADLEFLYAALAPHEREELRAQLEQSSSRLGSRQQLPASAQELTSTQAMLAEPVLFYLRNSLWSRYTNLDLPLLRQVAACYKYLADQQITMPVFIEMMSHAHALLDSVYVDTNNQGVLHNERQQFHAQTARLESYLAQHPIPAFNSQTFIDYFLPYQHKLEAYLEHFGISQGEVRGLQLHGLAAGYKILERLVQLDLHHHLAALRSRMAFLNWKGLDLERYLPENLAPQLQPSEQEIHGIVYDVVSNYSRLLERTLQLEKLPVEKRANYAAQIATLNQNLALITKRCEEVFVEMNAPALGITDNGHLNGVEFEIDVHIHKGEYAKRLQNPGAVDNRHALRYAIANMFYDRQHELLVEAGLDIGKPNEPHGFGIFTQMAEHLFGTSLREIPVPPEQRRVQNLVQWLAIQPRQAQVMLEDLFAGQMRGQVSPAWTATPYDLDQVELWADYQTYREQVAQAQARYFQPLQPQHLRYQLDTLQSFLVTNNLGLPSSTQLPGQQLLAHNAALQAYAGLEQMVAMHLGQALAEAREHPYYGATALDKQRVQACDVMHAYLSSSVNLDAHTSQKLLRNLSFWLPTQQTVAQQHQQLRYLASWFAARELTLRLAGADRVVQLREELYRIRARMLEARHYALQHAHPALPQAMLGDAWAIAFVERHPEVDLRNAPPSANTQLTAPQNPLDKHQALVALAQEQQQRELLRAQAFDALNARVNDLLDADEQEFSYERDLAPATSSASVGLPSHTAWQRQLAGELTLANAYHKSAPTSVSESTEQGEIASTQFATLGARATLQIPAPQLGILPGWQTPAAGAHLRFEPETDLSPIHQAVYQGLVNLTDGDVYYLLPSQVAQVQQLRRNLLGKSYDGYGTPYLSTLLPRPLLRQFYSAVSGVRPQGLTYSLDATLNRYTIASLSTLAGTSSYSSLISNHVIPQHLQHLVAQVGYLDSFCDSYDGDDDELYGLLHERTQAGIVHRYLDGQSLSRNLTGHDGTAQLANLEQLTRASLRSFYATFGTEVPHQGEPDTTDAPVLGAGQLMPVAWVLRGLQGTYLPPPRDDDEFEDDEFEEKLPTTSFAPVVTSAAHANLSVWFAASQQVEEQILHYASEATHLAPVRSYSYLTVDESRPSLGWLILSPVDWLRSGALAMREIYNRAIYMARQQLLVGMQLQAQAWQQALRAQGFLRQQADTYGERASASEGASFAQLAAWRDAVLDVQVEGKLRSAFQTATRGLEQTLRDGTQLTTNQLTDLQIHSYRQAAALGAQQARNVANYDTLAAHYRAVPRNSSFYQLLTQAGLESYIPVAGSLITLAPDLTRSFSASEQQLLLQLLQHYADPNLPTAALVAEFRALADRHLVREVSLEAEAEATPAGATSTAALAASPALQTAPTTPHHEVGVTARNSEQEDSSLSETSRTAVANLVTQLTLTPVTAPARHHLTRDLLGESILAQLESGKQSLSADEVAEKQQQLLAQARAAQPAVFGMTYALGTPHHAPASATQLNKATPRLELELVNFTDHAPAQVLAPVTTEYVTVGSRKLEVVSFEHASAEIQAAVTANQLAQSDAQFRAAQERQRQLTLLQVREAPVGELSAPQRSDLARAQFLGNQGVPNAQLQTDSAYTSELTLSALRMHATADATAHAEELHAATIPVINPESATSGTAVYLPYSVALHRRHYQQLFQTNRLAAYACLQLDGYALWRGLAPASITATASTTAAHDMHDLEVDVASQAWNNSSLLELQGDAFLASNVRWQYAHLVQRISRVATGLQELSSVAPLFVRPTPSSLSSDRLQLVPYFAPSWLYTLIGLAREWQRNPTTLQEAWVAARVALEGYVANPTTPYHQLFRMGWLQTDTQEEQHLNSFLKWFAGQMPEFPEGEEPAKLPDGSIDFASLPASKFKLTWLQAPERRERAVANALQHSQDYQLTPHSSAYYRSYVQTTTRAQEGANYTWIKRQGRKPHEDYAGFFPQARRVVRYIHGFIAQSKQRALQAHTVRQLQARSAQHDLWWSGQRTNLAQLEARLASTALSAPSVAQDAGASATASNAAYNLNPRHQAVLHAQLRQRQERQQRLFDSYSLLIHIPYAFQNLGTLNEERCAQIVRTARSFEEIRLVPNYWKLNGLHNYTYEHSPNSADHVLQGWEPEHPLDPAYHDSAPSGASELQQYVHRLLVAQQQKQRAAIANHADSPSNPLHNIEHSTFFLLYAKQLALLAGQDPHVSHWGDYAGQLAARIAQLREVWSDSLHQTEKLAYLQSFAYLQNFSLIARPSQRAELAAEQLTDLDALYAQVDVQAWQETLTSLATLPVAELQLLQELPRYANLALNLMLLHQVYGEQLSTWDNPQLARELGLNAEQLHLVLLTLNELMRNPSIIELVAALNPAHVLAIEVGINLQRELQLQLLNAILTRYFLNASRAQREAYATLIAWAQQASYHALTLLLLNLEQEVHGNRAKSVMRKKYLKLRSAFATAEPFFFTQTPNLAWDALCDTTGVVRELRAQLREQEVQSDYRSYGAHVLEQLRLLFGNPREVRNLRLSSALLSAQSLLAQAHPNLMRHAIAVTQTLLDQTSELAQLTPWNYAQYRQVYQLVRLYVLHEVSQDMEIAQALGRSTSAILAHSGVGALHTSRSSSTSSEQVQGLIEQLFSATAQEGSDQEIAQLAASVSEEHSSLQPFEIEELFATSAAYNDPLGRFSTLNLADYEPQFVIFNLVRLNCMRVAQMLSEAQVQMTTYQAVEQLVRLFFTSAVTEVQEEEEARGTTNAQATAPQEATSDTSDDTSGADLDLAQALATWRYEATQLTPTTADEEEYPAVLAVQTLRELCGAGALDVPEDEAEAEEDADDTEDYSALQLRDVVTQHHNYSTSSTYEYDYATSAQESDGENAPEEQEQLESRIANLLQARITPRAPLVASQDLETSEQLTGAPRDLALGVEELQQSIAHLVAQLDLPLTVVTEFNPSAAWNEFSEVLEAVTASATSHSLWELAWALRGRNQLSEVALPTLTGQGQGATTPTTLNQLIAQVSEQLASYYATLGTAATPHAAQNQRKHLATRLHALVAPYVGSEATTSASAWNWDWFCNWVDPYQIALQYAGQEHLRTQGSRLRELPTLASLYGSFDASGLARYTSLSRGVSAEQLRQLQTSTQLTLSDADFQALLTSWQTEFSELQRQAAHLSALLSEAHAAGALEPLALPYVHVDVEAPVSEALAQLQQLCTRLTHLRGMAYWLHSWNSYVGSDPRLGNSISATTAEMEQPDLERIHAYVRERLELQAQLEPLLANLTVDLEPQLPTWSEAQSVEFAHLVAQADYLPDYLWNTYYPELVGYDSSNALYALLASTSVDASLAPTRDALAQLVRQRVTMVATLYVISQLAQAPAVQERLGGVASSDADSSVGTHLAPEVARSTVAVAQQGATLVSLFWNSVQLLQTQLRAETYLSAPTLLSWLGSVTAWNRQVVVDTTMEAQLEHAVRLLEQLHWNATSIGYWLEEQALLDTAVRLQLAEILPQETVVNSVGVDTSGRATAEAQLLAPPASSSPWYALNAIEVQRDTNATYLELLSSTSIEQLQQFASWYLHEGQHYRTTQMANQRSGLSYYFQVIGLHYPRAESCYLVSLSDGIEDTPWQDELKLGKTAGTPWYAPQELRRVVTLTYDLPRLDRDREQELAAVVLAYYHADFYNNLGMRFTADFHNEEVYQLFTFNLDPRQVAELSVDTQSAPGAVILRQRHLRQDAQSRETESNPSGLDPEAYVLLGQEYDRWGNPVVPTPEHWLTWALPQAPHADRYGLRRYRTGDLRYRPNQRRYATELVRNYRAPLFLDSYAPVAVELADGELFMRTYHALGVVTKQLHDPAVANFAQASSPAVQVAPVQEAAATSASEAAQATVEQTTCYAAQVVLGGGGADPEAQRQFRLDLFRLGMLSQVLAQRAQAQGHVSLSTTNSDLHHVGARTEPLSPTADEFLAWEVDELYQVQIEIHQAQRMARLLRTQYVQLQERALQLGKGTVRRTPPRRRKRVASSTTA